MEKELEKILKKKKTFDEQITLLKNRKLIINNDEEVKVILSKVNYYRLSGYFSYFYKVNDEFKEGTKFEDIYNLYKFDTELRRLFMELIEEIEISFRTYIAYYIAHNFDEYAYLDADNFYDKKYHSEFIEILNKKIESYKDKAYIKHHKKIYKGKIPIWVVVEVLSFTDLSKLYSNIKTGDHKKIIHNNYTDKDVINNSDIVKFWIHSLSEIRNKCAHYERLFDSKVKKYIKLPQQYISEGIRGNSLFASLIIFKLLINDEILWNSFIERFKDIVLRYKFKNFDSMGFVESWESILTRKKD
jgi:abortive infection bacteriophage resistance protein